MTVYDLNRDQLAELKSQYYSDKTGFMLSYGELADIDNIVSDKEIYDAYAGTEFVPDDFFSSSGQDDEEEKFIISDGGKSFLHATSAVYYEWSDWAASLMNMRQAQDALRWAKKEGFKKAFAITITA